MQKKLGRMQKGANCEKGNYKISNRILLLKSNQTIQ